MARDIRVCHVITLLEMGGAQDNTLYTATHLRPPFVPSLVCGPGGMRDDDARRSGIPVTFVPSLVRAINPVRDLAAIAGLARIFRRVRPAIVHTHSSKAGIVGRVAARLAGVPVVVHSVHGFGFNRTQPAPLRALLVGLERLVAPLTTRFVLVSRANLDLGVRLGVVPADRATVIRSGVRIGEFAAAAADPALRNGAGLRHELGIPAGTPLVGMIACLKPQKAPLVFIDVAARVAARRPHTHFVLAGDGELRPLVEARIREAGLQRRVHLLGWRRDIPRLLAALDVMVLTSLWEGLPRVLPEAIAAGVPIVATGVDGTNDILRDGESGVVRPPGDCDGLARGVEAILRDPEIGRALADRARATLPEFDIDRMVRDQERLYHALLDGGPAR
jgi:glycosyltransferase involved in cell wall biosynthesis